MDSLHENKYIEMEIGYYSDKIKRETRIWATAKLLKLFPVGHPDVRYRPAEFVELWKIEKRDIYIPKLSVTDQKR